MAYGVSSYDVARMQQVQVKVGKDVEAACRKCGEVWHVVVSMDDKGVITKVQCKECSGYHRYKPPAGEERVDAKAAPKAAAVRRVAPSKSRAPGRTPAAKSRRSGDEPKVDPDLSRPVRGYSMRDAYAPGDRIEHPKFGQGVVESIGDEGKMSVFFEDGRRTLAHAR